MECRFTLVLGTPEVAYTCTSNNSISHLLGDALFLLVPLAYFLAVGIRFGWSAGNVL